MEPHANTDRAIEGIAGCRCGGERARRRREGDEERVALRIHLDPAVRGDRLADDAAVRCERVGVRIGAELVEQLRRAFHVGEEEGDRPGRKLGAHVCMMLRDDAAGRGAASLNV